MDQAEILEEFEEKGYAVVPDALSEDEVRYLNHTLDRLHEDDPDAFYEATDGVLYTSKPFHDHPEKIDQYIRNEGLLPLFRQILGDDLRFANWSLREVLSEATADCDLEMHRDIGYYAKEMNGRLWDPENPYTSVISGAIVYLTDVDPCCPCFCIVPDSHEYENATQARAEMAEEYREHEIRASAGTAILYNITEYHCRRAGEQDCQHGRRTMHTHYAQSSSPPMSDRITLPESLARSSSTETRQFYSLWSPAQIEYAKETYDNPPNYYL